MPLQYQETPIQEICDGEIQRAGVRVIIKREDLNHALVSGNKWWKLKYNLEEAVQRNFKTILTFGGAYSNHILAIAVAAHELNLKSIGVIRGEETLPLNPILSFVKNQGMDLVYVSRSAYRSEKTSDKYAKKFGNPYCIPEGGSNLLAVRGVADFALTLNCHFDYICCAVGTGGTISGLIEGLSDEKKIIGFPVLKGAEFLKQDIYKLSAKSKHASNWELMCNYHFGGYAKTTSQLNAFIDDFRTMHNIPLEYIYTGKMMAGS